MDFFRKYQRIILYTAGIFALVSFSISAPILGFFGSLFRQPVPLPTMRIDGRIVKVTMEDEEVATELVRRERSFVFGAGFLGQDPAVAMPPVRDPRSQDDQRTIYAALRRLAIHYGIEVSEDEVDKAIQQALRVTPETIDTPEKLAAHNSFPSYADYRRALHEAMRIGEFVRVQGLVPAALDHELVDDAIKDLDYLTLQVASLNAKKLQDELEKQDISDDDLRAWIDGLDQTDKARNGYLGRDRFQLQILDLDVAKFDPAQFTAELADREFSDDEVQKFYDLQKARLFQVKKAPPPKDDKPGDTPKEKDKENGEQKPPEDGEKPGDKQADDKQADDQKTDEQKTADQKTADQKAADQKADEQKADEQKQEPEFQPLDDALRAQIRKRLQAEAVLRKLWQDVQAKLDETTTDEIAAQKAAQQALADAQKTLEAAKAAAAAPGATADQADALAAAQTTVDEQKAAVDAANQALETKRAAFDVMAAIQAVGADRPGLSIVETEGLKTVDELREIPIGTWDQSWAVSPLSQVGAMSTQVQTIPGHSFEFRVENVEVKPLKPFDEIREKARGDYFTKQADEKAETKKDAFEKSLLELAKQKIPDRIAELEHQRDVKLDEQMQEWRSNLESEIEKTRKVVQDLEAADPNSRACASAKARQARLEGDLAKADDHRAELQKQLEEDTTADIEKAAKEQYCAVLEQAAQDNGFEVTEVGPYPRDLSRRGGPRERFPETVQFLFWNPAVSDAQDGLEQGLTTDVLQDAAHRTWLAACAKTVEPGTVANLTRRQLITAREQIAPGRRADALRYSFTIDEALKERYGYQRPVSAQTEPADGKQPKAQDGAPGDK